MVNKAVSGIVFICYYYLGCLSVKSVVVTGCVYLLAIHAISRLLFNKVRNPLKTLFEKLA